MTRETLVVVAAVILAVAGRAIAADKASNGEPFPERAGVPIETNLPWVSSWLGDHIHDLRGVLWRPPVGWWVAGPLRSQSNVLEIDAGGRIQKIVVLLSERSDSELKGIMFDFGIKKITPHTEVDRPAGGGAVAHYTITIKSGSNKNDLTATVKLRPKDWWVADHVDDPATARAIREGRLLVGMAVEQANMAMDARPTQGKKGPDGQPYTWRTKGADGKWVTRQALVKDGQIVQVTESAPEAAAAAQ